MSFKKSTESKSPFTTSTSYNTRGATAFNESWVTVSGTTPPVASISGQGIAMASTPVTTGSDRVYFTNSNYLEQSSHCYYSFFQTYVTSIDEAIASGDTFSFSGVTNADNLDATVSRTHIFKVGY